MDGMDGGQWTKRQGKSLASRKLPHMSIKPCCYFPLLLQLHNVFAVRLFI